MFRFTEDTGKKWKCKNLISMGVHRLCLPSMCSHPNS